MRPRGGKENQKSTEFEGLSDEEVSKIAHDKNASPDLRKKAQKEEKARGNRNKQKRKSHYR